jgi:hypothetical protein
MAKLAVPEQLENGERLPDDGDAGDVGAAASRLEPAPSMPAAVHIPGTRSMLEARAPLDISVFYDPLRWLRWRREVRKLGPYAPAYCGRSVHLDRDQLRVGFVAVVMIVFTVVVVIAL